MTEYGIQIGYQLRLQHVKSWGSSNGRGDAFSEQCKGIIPPDCGIDHASSQKRSLISGSEGAGVCMSDNKISNIGGEDSKVSKAQWKWYTNCRNTFPMVAIPLSWEQGTLTAPAT